MISFRRMLAATAAGALLFSSTIATAATGSAAALSLANSPALAQDGGETASETGGNSTVWINIGILAALTAIVLVATGGGDGDDSPDSP